MPRKFACVFTPAPFCSCLGTTGSNPILPLVLPAPTLSRAVDEKIHKLSDYASSPVLVVSSPVPLPHRADVRAPHRAVV